MCGKKTKAILEAWSKFRRERRAASSESDGSVPRDYGRQRDTGRARTLDRSRVTEERFPRDPRRLSRGRGVSLRSTSPSQVSILISSLFFELNEFN